METADEVDRPLDMSSGRRASPPPYPAAESSTRILPSYPMSDSSLLKQKNGLFRDDIWRVRKSSSQKVKRLII